MSVSHNAQREPTRVDVRTVLEALPHRVEELPTRHDSSHEIGFEAFEQALHALFTQAECAATSEELERQDVDLPHVFIGAEKHHRALRGEKTSLCAVGPVTATRTLYRARSSERDAIKLVVSVGVIVPDPVSLPGVDSPMRTDAAAGGA